MDDRGSNLVTVLIDVVHIEVLSDSAIQLDGDHGILFAVHILSLDIDLRSVECCLTLCFGEIKIIVLQDLSQSFLGSLPVCLVSQIFFTSVGIPFGKSVGYIILQSQSCQHVIGKFQTSL